MADSNVSETIFKDFYSEKDPNESDHSNLSESDKHGVDIARYDMVFGVTDASFLNAENNDDKNFHDGSVTFKRFSQTQHLSSAAAGTSTSESTSGPTYRAYLVYETLRATYNCKISTNGMMFTNFELRKENKVMNLARCKMRLDMTEGPMDDAGYPLLFWKLCNDRRKGNPEHKAHGYAKRYDSAEGARDPIVLGAVGEPPAIDLQSTVGSGHGSPVNAAGPSVLPPTGHAVLSSSERKRIKSRENLG